MAFLEDALFRKKKKTRITLIGFCIKIFERLYVKRKDFL